MLLKTNILFRLKNTNKKNIVCAFSTRVHNYDLRAAASKNECEKILDHRSKFFKALKLDLNKAVFLKQVHKAQVEKVKKSEQGRGVFEFESALSETDAAITDLTGTALCLLTADCLPLLFWHVDEDLIGIAHAGWRGLKAGIAAHTAETMGAEFGCALGKIKVCIGPGIRSCCYEVDCDLTQEFPQAVRVHKKGTYLDLTAIAIEQLMRSGIKQDNIIDTKLCSKCSNHTFFSYRGKDKSKRMLSLIALTA